ncbi:cyclase family protein [Dictyobacter aurantiacus]|uniref:Cyclase n=1 Tax=Dictyobacter aurantiacus TaxID=1936993 RepID=A0A401ZSG0_9CHLR|nr:cyclase family protein [Dictyobacter aurantiacus]GCE09817.1 cyclase [Dictyobacter aurantiacus]
MSTAPKSILAQFLEGLQTGLLKVIDLTSLLEPETPVIDLPPMFAPSPSLSLTEISHYDERGPAWYWNVLNLGEHTGTHFDAPIHWITGKDLPNNSTDTIPVRKFVGPACVINVTAEVARDPDFLLSKDDVVRWEGQHGRIPSGAWVLLHTGWSQRQGCKAFLNIQDDGAHSPSLQQECIQFLITERDILGLGVETVGTDAGQAGGFNPPFPMHTSLHGSGRFGLTSLTNLDQLPATGAIVIAAPLKILKGSGSPLRVIAIIE